MLVILPILGYDALNDAGWVQRTRNVDLYMADDWLIGENRECLALQNTGSATEEREIASLYCPEEVSVGRVPHNISIKFWGRTKRKNVSSSSSFRTFHWRCTHEADAFVCRALD